jgi:hypothetical protein
VDVMVEHVDADGESIPVIRGLLKERFGDMPRPSFYSAFNTLKDKMIVTNGITAARFTLTSKAEK